MRLVQSLRTGNGQEIYPGTQVAFVDPIVVASKPSKGGHNIAVHGGQIKVAKVTEIEEKRHDGFSLHLDNGSTINCESVVVTDQKYTC